MNEANELASQPRGDQPEMEVNSDQAGTQSAGTLIPFESKLSSPTQHPMARERRFEKNDGASWVGKGKSRESEHVFF